MTTCDGQQQPGHCFQCGILRYLSHPLSWLNWVETNLYFMLCLSFGFSCTVDALWDQWGGGASRLCCVSASSSSLKPARLCPCFLCLSGRFCHLPHPQHYFCLFLASRTFFSHYSHPSYLWNHQNLAFIHITIPKCFFLLK